jgi:peroxiredoxin Q/BCP
MNQQNSIRRRTWKLLVAALMAGSLSMTAQAVEVGDSAPDFTLPGSDGQSYQLSDLRGQHVVIAFFPKAFTGG